MAQNTEQYESDDVMDDIDFMDTSEGEGFGVTPFLWMLSGAALGMAVMYLMDPKQGRRRRALIRSKATSLGSRYMDTVGDKMRDMTGRVSGTGKSRKSHARRSGRQQGEETSRGEDYLQ